jgi:hypothetical protein
MVSGSTYNFVILGERGFVFLHILTLCSSDPTNVQDRRKTAPLKTSVPLEAARVVSARVDSGEGGPLNGSHLLTHRCIVVAAKRLAGPIARSRAAHLKTSHPHFPIKQA